MAAAKKKRAVRASRVGIPYKKSEATRELLLATAIELIATRGLAATSLQDIAEAAGVSKGGVHYYFESKDDLYAKILQTCCGVLEERIIRVFLGGDWMPLERVQRALAEMWRVRREGVAEMRVLTELHMLARQDEPLRHALAEALRRARRQMIETGFTHMMAMGIRPRVDATLIPRMIIGCLDGLALHNEVDPLPEADDPELLRALEMMAMSLFEL